MCKGFPLSEGEGLIPNFEEDTHVSMNSLYSGTYGFGTDGGPLPDSFLGRSVSDWLDSRFTDCQRFLRSPWTWNQVNRGPTDRETNLARVAINFKTSTWIEKVLGEARRRAISLNRAYLLQNSELGALLRTVESPYTYLPADVIRGANN